MGCGAGGSVVLLLLWRPVAGILAGGAAVGVSAGVALLARHRIGGFTGDVLGALGVLGETGGWLWQPPGGEQATGGC